MKQLKHLTIFVSLALATVSFASMFSIATLVGDARVALKGGGFARVSINAFRSEEGDMDGTIVIRKETMSKLDMFEFQALNIDGFKTSSGLTYLEGTARVTIGTRNPFKTRFGLTVWDNSSQKGGQDFIDLVLVDSYGGTGQLAGVVMQGNFVAMTTTK